jgi:serine/threonine protein kinase
VGITVNNTDTNGGPGRLTGAVLGQRFQVLRTIRSSGRTTQYLARDRSGTAPFINTDGLVRLEVLSEKASQDVRQVELFRSEALAAARLVHTNIGCAAEAEADGSTAFRIAEYRPTAVSLRSVLDREGWLEARRAAVIARQIAAALAAARENGALHLKLDPDCVFIEAGDNVIVTDFGVDDDPEFEWIRRERANDCSVYYLSPEQISGAETDQRSDLYSLGVLLFEALTDRIPFDSAVPEVVKEKRLTQACLPPHLFRSEVPHDISKLVVSLLNKHPAERFDNATDLVQALDAVSVNAAKAPSHRDETTAQALVLATENITEPLAIEMETSPLEPPAEPLSDLEWPAASTDSLVELGTENLEPERPLNGPFRPAAKPAVAAVLGIAVIIAAQQGISGGWTTMFNKSPARGAAEGVASQAVATSAQAARQGVQLGEEKTPAGGAESAASKAGSGVTARRPARRARRQRWTRGGSRSRRTSRAYRYRSRYR